MGADPPPEPQATLGRVPIIDDSRVVRRIPQMGLEEKGRPLLVMHSNIYKGFKSHSDAPASGADEFVLRALDGSPLVQKVVQLLSRSERTD